MKKLSKIFLCIALVFCTTFGLTACSVGEVEENTRKAVETTTSIIPVEYTKETAEGIFNNALYNLFKADKVGVEYTLELMHGVRYEKGTMTQKVLIQDGKRYIAFEAENYTIGNESFDSMVIGMYSEDNTKMIIDLESKKYIEVANDVVGEEDDEPGTAPIVSLDRVFADALERLDIISAMGVLSENVVSGRYFDSATYINMKADDGSDISNVEVKIVDGKIVSISAFVTDDYVVSGWATYTFTYGDEVDVSTIPTTLEGLTKTTPGDLFGLNPAS